MNPSRPTMQQQASITDLPSELLLMIFKLVHSLVPPAGKHAYFDGWLAKEDFPNLTFPYNLSSVCRTWQDVMSLVPEFWTRLVVYVDVPWQPASLQEQLKWSKNLPFELILTKKNPDDNLKHPLEQRRTQSSVTTLMSQINRCTSFSILHLQSSSSLPSIATDFTHPANNLQTLRLDCQRDDGNKSFARSITDAPDVLSCSKLSQLFVDGENFLSLCLHTPTWFDAVTHLSVAHYDRASRGAGFSMTRFLATLSEMKQLSHLAIEDVDFGHFGRAVKTELPNLKVLELVSQNDIDKLFDRMNIDYEEAESLEELNIRFCELKCPSNSLLPNSDILCLEHVYCPDASKQAIVRYLYDWGGGVAEIDDCPFVNDIIWMIGLRGFGYLGWSNLFELSILNCRNLSISTLRETIAIRNSGYVQSGDTSFAITQLYLSGDVPGLSAEDVDFFTKHVECFEWEGSETD
ncbi:hypothetical protein HGRIS_011656 [Hohenbuehelia grisea]|uniref:F-box domain-containing protein n=1 Tax=Hohenbuehelia grisea TaxID=104357 RepID=A0ABR3JVS0_9AGAR